MSAVVVALHLTLARALLLFALLLGLWGGYQFLRHRAVSGGFRSSYLMLAGLTAVQGLFGAAAFLVAGHPRELLHVVYGIFAVIFLPGVYAWASGRARDTEAALLAAACWIVLIAYARGFTTGA